MWWSVLLLRPLALPCVGVVVLVVVVVVLVGLLSGASGIILMASFLVYRYLFVCLFVTSCRGCCVLLNCSMLLVCEGIVDVLDVVVVCIL